MIIDFSVLWKLYVGVWREIWRVWNIRQKFWPFYLLIRLFRPDKNDRLHSCSLFYSRFMHKISFVGSVTTVSCITKALLSFIIAAVTNFSLSKISVFLMVDKAFTTIWVIQTNSRPLNHISPLLKVKKNILRITFIMVLAKKKVS